MSEQNLSARPSRAEYLRQYRRNNPDRVRAINRASRDRHLEDRRKAERAYYEANRAAVNERQRQRYQAKGPAAYAKRTEARAARRLMLVVMVAMGWIDPSHAAPTKAQRRGWPHLTRPPATTPAARQESITVAPKPAQPPQLSDEDKIAIFLATRGVTKCPTRFAAPVSF